MPKTYTSPPENKLKQHVTPDPDIDWNRIEEARLAITNGNLSIDTNRLAQKIIDLEMAIESTSPKL